MYTFVFKNGGWWLSVKDLETLAKFHEVTDGFVFGDALKFHWETDEVKNSGHSKYERSAQLERAITMIAEKEHTSFYDAANAFHFTIFEQQAKAIKECGGIYINPVGGYHCFESKPVSHTFCHQEKLVWPKLTKRDIKVTRFPGGQHYYARVGTVEVRDENGIKWDTFEEAYDKALQLLGDLSDEERKCNA